ncbi:hypothetical protein [Rhizobium sp. G21]|uniref:hypothetical protein n=1 Tax=Rhizobium sp. G21 TaxID=2758439 RepID=UPI00160209AF|nr:hypothetical protein [Rhizobium sp. G21]MBB1249012.1 hypothetical protein [Rhizobium sp. G21]
MILLPLPFVVALFLAVFAVRYARIARERGDDAFAFVALMTLFAFQSILVGARWGYGATALQPVMATTASILPPAAFLAFRGLTGERRGRVSRTGRMRSGRYWFPVCC